MFWARDWATFPRLALRRNQVRKDGFCSDYHGERARNGRHPHDRHRWCAHRRKRRNGWNPVWSSKRAVTWPGITRTSKRPLNGFRVGKAVDVLE